MADEREVDEPVEDQTTAAEAALTIVLADAVMSQGDQAEDDSAFWVPLLIGGPRLVYVDDSFAWFCSDPATARGDDWNDAPHHCNAGTPYPESGGDWVKVAFDGDLELVGTEPDGIGTGRWGYLSVDQINEGAAPWLVQLRYGAPTENGLIATGAHIPAGVTVREFEALVGFAGGDTYYTREHLHARALTDANLDRAAAAYYAADKSVTEKPWTPAHAFVKAEYRKAARIIVTAALDPAGVVDSEVQP